MEVGFPNAEYGSIKQAERGGLSRQASGDSRRGSLKGEWMPGQTLLACGHEVLDREIERLAEARRTEENFSSLLLRAGLDASMLPGDRGRRLAELEQELTRAKENLDREAEQASCLRIS